MKDFRSLRFKNFLTTAAILLMSFLLLGSAFSIFTYRYARGEKRRAMGAAASEVIRVVSAHQSEMELNDLELRMAITSLSNTSGFQVLLCGEDGTVVSCSDPELSCPHLGRHLPAEITEFLQRGGQLSGVAELDGLFGAKRYYLAVPGSTEGENSFFVVLSCDISSMTGVWRRFSSIFIMTAVAVMLIAFVVSGITSERVTRPINAIAAAADRFAGGDYGARVEGPVRNDEIGELTEAFNAMADSIEHQEIQRREFIANVSHELKTPMTTITGFADGILDGTIPPEAQDRYLAAISSETKRLSRLVRNMLETSRLQAMDRTAVMQKTFEITEVVGSTLLGLEQRINARHLDVDARLPEDRIFVRGDQDGITEVVYNLLDNAVKFAEEGSVLRIDLWKREKKVYVSIRDRGETIPREELPRIFDRFHKADHSRSRDPDGVGLGLYIVKTILTNHGEDIFVTSENGETCFTFTLTVV